MKLNKKMKIGVMSPSSSINPERFGLGLSILQNRGHQVTVHPQTTIGADSGDQLAGTIHDKASAFIDLWTNPDIDIIMAACGGNFSAQFLHLFDYQKLSETPKTLIGFSDTTALLSAIYAKTRIGGIFGPTVQSLGRIDNLDNVLKIIEDTENPSIDFSGCTALSPITETKPAPLYAATLSVLLSLAGTPYFPKLSGHILILEDIGEELSSFDRALWQLNTICPFKDLAGIIFGEFVDMKDTGRPLGLDFIDIIQKTTSSLHCPVIINAPVGHGARFLPIPLGRLARIDFNSPSPRLILQ